MEPPQVGSLVERDQAELVVVVQQLARHSLKKAVGHNVGLAAEVVTVVDGHNRIVGSSGWEEHSDSLQDL